MQKFLIYIFTPLLVVLVFSCGEELQTREVETPELEMVAEGPLFEGANTATASWEFDLQSLLGEDDVRVSQAKVTSIKIKLVPQEDLPEIDKMVFEITSQNTSMTRVGLFEQGIKQGETINLSLADNQENITKAFQDGKMTFVGDFDLMAEEFWGNVRFMVKVTFELGLK
jgi:hypothetical protein